MCGISGVIGKWPNLNWESFRTKMYRRLAHRGPNAFGCIGISSDFNSLVRLDEGKISPEVNGILIHTRLSILEISDHARQPVISVDQNHAVVFNGEIYNYREIGEELKSHGIMVRGGSDTEIILPWLKLKGEDGIKRFSGMYSIIWINLLVGKAYIFRDRYGVKPLYFAKCSRAIAFASEPQVLQDLPGLGLELDRIQVLETLRYGASPTQRRQTIRKGILNVVPGEKIVVELNDASKLINNEPQNNLIQARYRGSFEDAKRDVKSIFLKSVGYHMQADVPVGAGLSGGIDSSSVVAAMSHISGQPANVLTISYLAKEKHKTEEKWVDVFNCGLRHNNHKITANPDRLALDIDNLIKSQGEPFPDTSIYAQYCVYRKAHEIGIKVMLEGQGADELFAGYNYYITSYLQELIVTRQWSKALTFVTGNKTRISYSLTQQIISLARLNSPTKLSEAIARKVGNVGLPNWVINRDAKIFFEDLDHDRILMGSGLQFALKNTRETRLVNLFRYCDRNSMAFSVEARVPFMFPELVELAQSLPSEYLFSPTGASKYILREAMRGLVPNEILDRTDKIGFENDDTIWLFTKSLSPWVETILRDSVKRCGLINEKTIRAEWNSGLQGQRGKAKRFWNSLIFLRWLELNNLHC